MTETKEEYQNGASESKITDFTQDVIIENEGTTSSIKDEITPLKIDDADISTNDECTSDLNAESSASHSEAQDQSENPENENQSSVKRSNQDAGDASPRKKPRNAASGDIEMRCIIPSICAGGIIGPGGNNIKDMRETFKAKISMPDTDASERIFMATGSIENCAEILLRILPSVNEGRGGRSHKENKNRPSDVLYVRLLIHQSQTGALIGRGGYKIKALRDETGANVSIDTECYFDSTDRLVRISGSGTQVMKCVERILRVAAANPPTGPIFKFDPGFGNDPNFIPNNNFRGGYNNRRGWGGPPNRGRMGGFWGRRGGRGRGPGRGRRGHQGGFSDDF